MIIIALYCVIPEMQGPYRSKTIEQIKTEALQLAEQGVTELVLVAQDTSYYGKDLYGRFALVDLLKSWQPLPKFVGFGCFMPILTILTMR